MESTKSELMAALQKEAEAARRRSQRLVEIGKRMPSPHEQNELITMALAEGRAAEVFDRAMEFLHDQAKS